MKKKKNYVRLQKRRFWLKEKINKIDYLQKEKNTVEEPAQQRLKQFQTQQLVKKNLQNVKRRF